MISPSENIKIKSVKGLLPLNIEFSNNTQAIYFIDFENAKVYDRDMGEAPQDWTIDIFKILDTQISQPTGLDEVSKLMASEQEKFFNAEAANLDAENSYLNPKEDEDVTSKD